MILSNLESVPGFSIKKHFGLVTGSTVRGKDFLDDLFASLKNIFGGELQEYTSLLDESRDQALQRIQNHAEKLGANAIVGLTFSTSNIADEASELFVYGTAVYVEPLDLGLEQK